jgi:signal transduction histidine kinase
MNGHEVWGQTVSSPSGTDQRPRTSVPYLPAPDIPATTADTDGAVEQLATRPAPTVAAPQPQGSAVSDVIVPPAEDELQANLAIIARHAVRQGVDCCIVWLLSSDGHQLQPLAFAHRNPHQAASMHRRLQPIPVNDEGRPLVEALGTAHEVPGTKPARNIVLPLHTQGQDLGIFEITVALGTWPSAVGVSEIVQQLANQATLTIENARLRRQLDMAERQLREYPGRLLIARERERKRIAYDIHDGFAQFATAAHQHLQAVAHAQRLRDPETHRQLSQVTTLLQQAIREARAIIADIPPPTLHERGLAAAIRHQLVAIIDSG